MKLKSEFHKLSPDKRLYQFEKPIVGLTGGIATGKSTVSKLLTARGIQIIDADQLVKNIYKEEDSIQFVDENFPAAIRHGEIDFRKLRELVFSDPEIKAKIETFIYARLPDAFKETSEKINQDFIVYDVPLLFERQLHSLVDLVIVVYAPEKVQLARIIDRDGSSEEIAKKILSSQINIEDKKNKADLVIDNSRTLAELTLEIDVLLERLLV